MAPTSSNIAQTEAPVSNKGDEWKLDLLGPHLLSKNDANQDVETGSQSIETLEALKNYKFLALFIGADYCPHCKELAPKVVKALPYFEKHSCKVVALSNDRSDEAFERTRQKLSGIDLIPLDTARTRQVRDQFGLQTIPALLIFALSGDQADLLTNARHAIEHDGTLKNFPWNDKNLLPDTTSRTFLSKEGSVPGNSEGSQKKISWTQRFLIHADHGNWYDLGHHNLPGTQHPGEMYMDEHAVRIRAGILNIITWFALVNFGVWRDSTVVWFFFPLVGWEFLASIVTGLTPLAPLGVMATMIAIQLHPTPLWKPANPKRFAWAIGFVLATMCFLSFELWGNRWMIGSVIIMCNIATWLEAAAGFCVGCFLYNSVVVPYVLKDTTKACDECKI